ncbi:MAG: hypothetical protein KGI83_06375, partial [Verrucomicrobiota bacterium]|nr:hypothetical protein [Verrucomicrobiota bacterium]
MLGWFLFLPLAAFSSLLVEADTLAQKVCLEVAKAPPPSLEPQTAGCLKICSVWFSIDLASIEAPAFDTLAHAKLWDILRDIGVQGIYLQGLKAGGEYRTAMGLDPKWGTEWEGMSAMMRKKGFILIGDRFGTATGLTPDFALALKNTEGYRGLYHLVEINPKDWGKLPNVSKGFANVPWLTLQTLHKKGYVPEQFSPYVKESSWNATPVIRGVDGKERRWIYLKENQNDPVMNWLGPSFAGCRIATGDLLDSMLHLGQKIGVFHEQAAQESLLLWTRKLGGFSVFETDGGLSEWMHNGADLWVDHFTRPALLHALIAQDAEALKLIYRVFLEAKIPINRLVHMLQPYHHFACDYAILSS